MPRFLRPKCVVGKFLGNQRSCRVVGFDVGLGDKIERVGFGFYIEGLRVVFPQNISGGVRRRNGSVFHRCLR